MTDKEAIRARLAKGPSRFWAQRDVAALLDALDERDRQRDEALALHYPKDDGPFSLVRSPYCACGAMESYLAEDGHWSIGPVRYPCATARALGVTDG